MVEVGTRVFIGGLEDRDLLEEKKKKIWKHRRFKQDIQIQIGKRNIVGSKKTYKSKS